MDYKIIQVIPNTKELMASYKDEKGIHYSNIVCFALVEYEDGEREVKPMDIGSDGMIDFPDTCSNFIEIIKI